MSQVSNNVAAELASMPANVGTSATPLHFRRVYVFADAFTAYHFRAFSVADAFADAVKMSPGVRLRSVDGRPVSKLEAFAAAHYVADVRPVPGGLRVACDATNADGSACCYFETIPATLSALRALLGY